jgi:signal transduction histidine kinase
MSRWAPVAAAVSGVLVTAATVASLGMSASMTWSLAWRAVVTAVGCGGVGWVALVALSRSSLGAQAMAVGLTSVLAVGVTYATTLSMYTTSHDLEILLVVLVGAASVGVVIALFLGRRVYAASQSLGETARLIGDGRPPDDPSTPMAVEFASLRSELSAMSDRLEEARAHERALEASRRELVAWVSHDLRTPLAGIRAITEALEDGVVENPETIRRYYKTLRRESDQLANLVNDLFELSRIQAGALALEMERASLSDIVSDALAAADPMASAKGVHLEGELRQVVPELPLSTPNVARVLRNLLENAIRHTPSDGTIWVATGTDGDEAYVSVTDTCGGIADESIDRVFDMAFRGESSRTRSEGTESGLGLAIAKGLVEAHAGTIAVANADEGCRFTFTLPLARSNGA